MMTRKVRYTVPGFGVLRPAPINARCGVSNHGRTVTIELMDMPDGSTHRQAEIILATMRLRPTTFSVSANDVGRNFYESPEQRFP